MSRQAENSSRSLIYPPAIIPFLFSYWPLVFLIHSYFLFFFFSLQHSFNIYRLFFFFSLIFLGIFFFDYFGVGSSYLILDHLSLSFLKYFVSRFPRICPSLFDIQHSFFIFILNPPLHSFEHPNYIISRSIGFCILFHSKYVNLSLC